MTVFFYFFLGWAGAAAVALIFNYAIHGTDEDDD
jgi:hypothetical protein